MLSVLVVNNGTDAPVSNELSLRQAIALANADAAAGISDTIAFDASLGSSTIKLTQGQLELSGAGAGTITIDGSSPSTPIALSAAARPPRLCDRQRRQCGSHQSHHAGRLGRHESGGDIFNAGTLTVSNAILSEGTASYGGGIENQGTLTLSNVTLTSNSANNSGGAIDSTGTLTVSDSTFTRTTPPRGGAISSEGTLTVNNSTFSGNYATATQFRRGHRQLFRHGHHHRRLLHRQPRHPWRGSRKQRRHRYPHERHSVQQSRDHLRRRDR